MGLVVTKVEGQGHATVEHVIAQVRPKGLIDSPCEFQRMRELMDNLEVALRENSVAP